MTRILLTVLAGLLLVAAPASAASYKGKTKGGSSITFKLKGTKISKVSTVVPTVCVETTGGFGSRSGAEIYKPPGAFKLGKQGKKKKLQPAAMNQGIEATKNYTFTSKRKKSGRITGKLKLNFSFLIPSLYGASIYICSGSTSYSAKAR
jgi:hypothetical protein